MAFISVMAKPSNENKLSARTAPAIVEEVKLLVVKLARTDLKYRRRRMNIEGLIGAVLQDFLNRSPDEQEAILRLRIPEVEAMFETEAQEIEKPAEGRASFKDAVNIPDPRGRKIEKPKPS